MLAYKAKRIEIQESYPQRAQRAENGKNKSGRLEINKFSHRFKCLNKWPPGTSCMTKNENFQNDSQTS